MGLNSTAILYYGVIFPKNYTFPWTGFGEFDDIDEWWLYKVNEYKNPVEIFTSEGEYINGCKPSVEDDKLYYDTKGKAKLANPLPVKIEYAGVDDYRQTIIASWTQEESWGGDPVILPKDLDHKNLMNFLEKYCKSTQEYDEQPEFELNLRLASTDGYQGRIFFA